MTSPSPPCSAETKSATRSAWAAASPMSRTSRVKLECLLAPEQAVAACHGITEIFRDQLVLRESRDRARMKYLFLRKAGPRIGSSTSCSRVSISSSSGVAGSRFPRTSIATMSAFIAQKQPGLGYVGASVLRGRMSGEQFEAAAELADTLRQRALRATVMQNLIFSMCQRKDLRSWPASWTDRHARRRIDCSGAAPSPAPALSSASWPSLKLRASPVAGGGNGRPPARIRSAAQAARHWMPQRLRPALDRRHRPRRQEDQARRQTDRRLLLSASAARSVSMQALRGRLATAALPRLCRKLSSACCGSTSDRGTQENLRAWFLRAHQ